jgi:hypothetical protein
VCDLRFTNQPMGYIYERQHCTMTDQKTHISAIINDITMPKAHGRQR